MSRYKVQHLHLPENHEQLCPIVWAVPQKSIQHLLLGNIDVASFKPVGTVRKLFEANCNRALSTLFFADHAVMNIVLHCGFSAVEKECGPLEGNGMKNK